MKTQEQMEADTRVIARRLEILEDKVTHVHQGGAILGADIDTLAARVAALEDAHTRMLEQRLREQWRETRDNGTPVAREQPAAPTPDAGAGDGWRFVADNEVLIVGDEYLDRCNAWCPLAPFATGHAAPGGPWHNRYRRRVTPPVGDAEPVTLPATVTDMDKDTTTVHAMSCYVCVINDDAHMHYTPAQCDALIAALQAARAVAAANGGAK